MQQKKGLNNFVFVFYPCEFYIKCVAPFYEWIVHITYENVEITV